MSAGQGLYALIIKSLCNIIPW